MISGEVMKITLIEKNKKNKKRYFVYVDDKYSFSISEEDYISMNLYEKKEITEEEIKHIVEVVNLREAKSTAVRYLSLRLRSEYDVRCKLKREGYGNKTIDKAIDEVKSLGYINDRLFVQKYVFDRIKLNPKSKKMLKCELMNKGIPEEIIDVELKEFKMDDTVIAKELVRRKFGKYYPFDDKITRRIYSFLFHRGFNQETINQAVTSFKQISD